MANLPNDPQTPITRSGVPNPNDDLPVALYPALQRIEVIDLVGPEATNRQPAQLEKRTDDLFASLNTVIAFCNNLDNYFLRRDSAVQKDSLQGLRANLIASLFKIVNLHDGALPVRSANWTSIQISKSGSTVTQTGGTAFTLDMCGDLAHGNGNYLLWSDQTIDQITAFVDAGHLTVTNVLSVLQSQPATTTGSSAFLYLSSKDAVNADQLWQVLEAIKGVDLIPLLPRDGTRPMYSDLDMGGGGGVFSGEHDPGSPTNHKIINLAPGSISATTSKEAVNGGQLYDEATVRHTDDVNETNARIAEDLTFLKLDGTRQMANNCGWGGFGIYNAACPGPFLGGNDTWLATQGFVNDSIRRYNPYTNVAENQFAIMTAGTMAIPPNTGFTDVPGLQITLNPGTIWATASPGSMWYYFELQCTFINKMRTQLVFTGLFDVINCHGQQFNHGFGETEGAFGYRSGISGIPGDTEFANLVSNLAPNSGQSTGVGVGSASLLQNDGVETRRGLHANDNSIGYMNPNIGASPGRGIERSTIVIYKGCIRVTSPGVLTFRVASHQDYASLSNVDDHTAHVFPGSFMQTKCIYGPPGTNRF